MSIMTTIIININNNDINNYDINYDIIKIMYPVCICSCFRNPKKK